MFRFNTAKVSRENVKRVLTSSLLKSPGLRYRRGVKCSVGSPYLTSQLSLYLLPWHYKTIYTNVLYDSKSLFVKQNQRHWEEYRNRQTSHHIEQDKNYQRINPIRNRSCISNLKRSIWALLDI